MRRRVAAPAPLSAQAGEQGQAIVEAAERGAQETATLRRPRPASMWQT